MGNLNILIAGGGIAGPVAAFWLLKTGAKITIVERSSSPRKTGQSIDIRGPAVTVMQKMGLEEAVRARGTHEQGTEKVYSNGKTVARFGKSDDPNNQTVTSEFEILRADLASVFTQAVEDQVEIVYGEYISGIKQHDGQVEVTFAHGRPSATYDLVIGADGQNSITRSLVRGKPARDDLHKLGAYCAYFTIPQGGSDDATFSRYYAGTNRRIVWTRPTPSGQTGAYLMVIETPDDRFSDAVVAGPEEQKRVIKEYFADAGYETQRILTGMYETDDFYYQEIAQVRLDEYYYGHVALLGDAGFCPSPMSGMGTSVAIYGAYILAGEILKQPDDLDLALKNYDKITHDFVVPLQKVPFWAFKLLNPRSQFGINMIDVAFRVIRVLVTLATWIKVDKFFTRILGEGSQFDPLPEYEWEGKKTQ